MNIIDIVIVLSILFLMVYLFVQLFRRSRGSGAGMFMISQGAMDAFLDPDKKKATEVIVEQNAGKKMEEQSAGGKPSPDNGAEKNPGN
jgi:hypothetical protein